MSKKRVNSICSVYVRLIRTELKKPNPDFAKIEEYLDFIEEHCHLVAYKDEVPPHLKDYLIKKGECAGVKGVVRYKGKLIPKVALCVAKKKKKLK